MTDLNELRLAASQPTLYIVSYLHWEREGRIPYEVQRAHLLDTIAYLIDALQTSDQQPVFKYFLLGGQTIILEDIAAVYPNSLTLLVINNAGGRIGIGPWYIQSDHLLIGGESIIRNLLFGRADGETHGTRLLSVAYLPQACQQPAQLPQILRNFGMDAAFLCTENPAMPLPFRWVAPDGSHVLVANYLGAHDLNATINAQRNGQPDGPFIWLNRCEQPGAGLPDTTATNGIKIQQAPLETYITALRDMLPDELRPTLRGAVNLKQTHTGDDMGRLSARMPVKQQHARLQTRLIYEVERWMAIALTHGTLPYPDNDQALLRHAWRLLMKNQTRSTLGGLSRDGVQSQVDIRNHRLHDVTTQLIDKALNALPGQYHAPAVHTTPDDDETSIVVWNPHSQQVQQVVGITLSLPADRHPMALLDPDGNNQPFAWDEGNKRLHFYADAVPVGYTVYTVRLSSEATPAQYIKVSAPGRLIGMSTPETQTLSINDGRLTWSWGAYTIQDVINFYDGGDMGDLHAYIEPVNDYVVQASMTDIVQTESTPVYERMIFRHRMRVAPQLSGETRRRGLRVIDLTTSATLYDNMPGVFFRTTFTNTADDHRLSVHLRTGIQANALWTASAFAMISQPISVGTINQPQLAQGLTALKGDHYSVALLTRGLPEVRPLVESQQTTLALTLMRAVGWLDKSAAEATPGAQLPQTTMTAHYHLMPSPVADNQHLLQAEQHYRAPLQAYQYHNKPETTRHSYLIVGDERLLLTAIKPPEKRHLDRGKGWMVRLLNPTDETITTTVQTAGALRRAELHSMAEVAEAEFEITDNRINVTLPPQRLATLFLIFSG